MLVRTAQDIGLHIRERRRELGLDQLSLARRVGVSRLWIIEFERGKPRAEIHLVLRTLIALGLQLDLTVERDPIDEAAASDIIQSADDIDAIVRLAKKRSRRTRAS